ncbi:MAG: 30S ribosomal protein S20 [Candidatus Marinimicrobia bacterium]|nr:30S ribosomal protein S20 [Candidatus Neomarinimicrobiota bacterium]MDP6578191.1 30S ribosomal protein S20 [Candidatus Neomarinimicrobiota bacterium]MDP7061007.1 30S ribosomal protein S20 [Candidatus Neomarinimicrobiota bacterium]
MSSRTKSVIKRQRQQTKNYDRNLHYKSKMKSIVKKVMSSQDKNEAETLYREAVSIIDNLTSKKILHRNTAARRKSSLTKHVNSLS